LKLSLKAVNWFKKPKLSKAQNLSLLNSLRAQKTYTFQESPGETEIVISKEKTPFHISPCWIVGTHLYNCLLTCGY
jgi:hypothetical protein